MQASIQPFAIGDVSIRQLDGLFSLNDLHRSSGGESKHQPALFLRLDQTQALVSEISSSTDSQSLAVKTVLGKGKQQGTYACRELVIAYAAWISAAFHLKVIRVFLDASQPSATITPAQQQHLKELVDLVVESGKQKSHAETWARLHRKFGIPRYTELPAVEFDAACQYLRGKLDAPSIAALINKHLPHALPAPETPPSLIGRRWLVWFDHEGREQHMALAERDCIFQWADVPRHIESGSVFDDALIARIGQACLSRLLEMQQTSSQAAQALRRQLKPRPPALAA